MRPPRGTTAADARTWVPGPTPDWGWFPVASKIPEHGVPVARLAAHTKWATTDPVAGTEAARSAALLRFERQVDPDGVLPPQERARRAESLRKAYFTKIALRSAQARRKGAVA